MRAGGAISTLTKRIIPCLDIKDGRVVKGIHFEGLRDAGDPVAAAKAYDAQGADELCFLDITASLEGRETILEVVRSVAEQIFIPLTVGGGIRTVEAVRQLLLAGADKVSLNTAAASSPELVSHAAEEFGSQCIVVAIDAQRTASGWEVYTHGGTRPTGIGVVDWACRMEKGGAGEILLTSMDRDGTRAGYDLELIRAVSSAVPIPVIASGGAGHPDHLYEALAHGGADAVLAASVFHYGQYTVRTVKEHLANYGIAVRL